MRAISRLGALRQSIQDWVTAKKGNENFYSFDWNCTLQQHESEIESEKREMLAGCYVSKTGTDKIRKPTKYDGEKWRSSRRCADTDLNFAVLLVALARSLRTGKENSNRKENYWQKIFFGCRFFIEWISKRCTKRQDINFLLSIGALRSFSPCTAALLFSCCWWNEMKANASPDDGLSERLSIFQLKDTCWRPCSACFSKIISHYILSTRVHISSSNKNAVW